MRFKHWTAVVASCLLLAGSVSVVWAEVRLPAVISRNMVLQRDRPVPVWGWAEPGERVTVSIAGQSASAKAADDGHWQVVLPKLRATTDRAGLKMVVRGSSGGSVTVENVLVGDVWLCTGPSNIRWPVKRSNNARQEIPAADYPQIRFFTVEPKTAETPRADCDGRWVSCSPGTVGDFSAIGYYFARRLHKELDVPIGVLQSFWGGSRIEAWTSRKSLEAEPALKPILDWWDESVANFDPAKAEAIHRKQLESWRRAAAAAKSAGRRPPRKPQPLGELRSSPHRPANLYNGMIVPLVPYRLRGIISYQGLGNLFVVRHARILLPTMIRDWRAAWGQPELPFGMVQPAPYPCSHLVGNPEAYSRLREAQLLTLKTVANTGIAATMDLGDLEEVHFTNKQEVARRMALWALARVYERQLVYSGPMYESMTVEGDRIRIRFTHTGSGLITEDGKPPSHFTIAGAEGKFHPATAAIAGDTVVVHCDRVPRPAAVRFAWEDDAIPNLRNREGLPASLFRTDELEIPAKGQD